MHTNQSINLLLVTSFIAVFTCCHLFAGNAGADCGDAVEEQILFGYLAGGATLFLSCAGAVYAVSESGDEGPAIGVAVVLVPTAYVLAVSGTVYHFGQSEGCDGSFLWTVGGALAAPLATAIVAGILGRGNSEASFMGGLYGFALSPIGATIAYNLTDREDKSNNMEVIMPLMSVRF